MATVHLMESVAAYEALIEGKKSHLQLGWPQDLVVAVGGDIYERMVCVRAWWSLSTHRLVAMLDTIRNRILSFALEIEAQEPAAGEAEPGGAPPIPVERVQHIFATYIAGGTNIIAAGSSGVIQSANIQVNQGDAESLRRYLASVGVDVADVAELEEAIQSEPAPTSQSLPARVASWIGRMATKAASGAWEIGKSVGSDVLTGAVLKYYGL